MCYRRLKIPVVMKIHESCGWHINGCLSRMSLAWRMKSNLKSSDWLIHFINPNRGIGPIFDNFEDNWVGIILTWDETFLHARDETQIFMVFVLTSDFAIFCCSWNRDTISWRDVSRTIPPIIISFNMKWTLNCSKKFMPKESLKQTRTVCYDTVLFCFEQHLCQREISNPTHKHFQNIDPRFPQEPKINK